MGRGGGRQPHAVRRPDHQQQPMLTALPMGAPLVAHGADRLGHVRTDIGPTGFEVIDDAELFGPELAQGLELLVDLQFERHLVDAGVELEEIAELGILEDNAVRGQAGGHHGHPRPLGRPASPPTDEQRARNDGNACPAEQRQRHRERMVRRFADRRGGFAPARRRRAKRCGNTRWRRLADPVRSYGNRPGRPAPLQRQAEAGEGQSDHGHAPRVLRLRLHPLGNPFGQAVRRRIRRWRLRLMAQRPKRVAARHKANTRRQHGHQLSDVHIPSPLRLFYHPVQRLASHSSKPSNTVPCCWPPRA
uniref:Uncharacterized protein n=1 Tax=Ralstonia solanacearum TaxID=305 RepID=A0A0S4TU36_RALSL|nr:protein of unknown function [Ralstonia solanacearum]